MTIAGLPANNEQLSHLYSLFNKELEATTHFAGKNVFFNHCCPV